MQVSDRNFVPVDQWDIEATAEEIARRLSTIRGGRLHAVAYEYTKAGAREGLITAANVCASLSVAEPVKTDREQDVEDLHRLSAMVGKKFRPHEPSSEPVKTAPAVAVKALEWIATKEMHRFLVSGTEIVEYASKGKFRYTLIKNSGGSWNAKRGRYGVVDYGTCVSLGEAKAAAQADYEARIRSALSAQVQDVAGQEPYGAPGPDVMHVIDPDQWEPCSPSYLSRGGCCATAPRVWNVKGLNHWHPKLATPHAPQAEQEKEG